VTLATFAIRGDGQDGDRFRLGAQGELVAPEKLAGPEEPELAAGDGVPVIEVAPQPIAAPKPPLEEQTSEGMVLAEERPAIPFMPRGGTLFGVGVEEAPKKGARLLLRLLWVFILLAILAAVAGYMTRIYLPESGISK
jgi:hypothetical protein